MTDWLARVPVYHSLAEAEQALQAALREEEKDREEDPEDGHEMYGRDFVLAGLVAYLATLHPEPLQEQIFSLLDVYCGKPTNVVVDADPISRCLVVP